MPLSGTLPKLGAQVLAGARPDQSLSFGHISRGYLHKSFNNTHTFPFNHVITSAYFHRCVLYSVYLIDGSVKGEYATLADGFHWSLSDSKSPQVSWTLLSILFDFNNDIVWMVLVRSSISNSSTPLIKSFMIVPSPQLQLISPPSCSTAFSVLLLLSLFDAIFSPQFWIVFFRWGLSDSKPSLGSMVLLIIPADFNNAVVLRVLILLLVSRSPNLFSRPFETVLVAPTTIVSPSLSCSTDIFFIFLAGRKYFVFYFIFTLWCAETAKSTSWQYFSSG